MMDSGIMIKILSAKRKKKPFEEEEGKEVIEKEEHGTYDEAEESDKPTEEPMEVDSKFNYSDKDICTAALRVGTETLYGKDLIEFVEEYKDKLLEDKSVNPFLS